MATQQTDLDLRRYAVVGAEARLLQIAQEAAAIYRVFPELRGRGQRGKKGDGVPSTAISGDAHNPVTVARARRRPKMSAAQRKAVSERMKKYWAGRRGGAEALKGTQSKQTLKARDKSRRRGGPRKMSAAARKRISQAQKARWAKLKGRARKG